MPEEVDPTVQHARQELIQRIVADVTEEHSCDPLDVVLAALTEGLEDAGFPPQPVKWLTDTASEISDGRHVVVDRHLAESNGDAADQVPAEAGRTQGDRRAQAEEAGRAGHQDPEGHEGHHLRDLLHPHH